MKRTFVLLLILFLTAFSFPVFSMEYVAGARGGYFIWDSWLQEIHPIFESMDKGSGVLYGPVGSILITQDLYFSVSGLFGKQSTSGTSENILYASQYRTTKYSFETFRMDIDSALSYRFTEYTKIFAGYKYWDLKTKANFMDFRYNTSDALEQVSYYEMEITQKLHGPAIGFGLSMPLGNKGFFAAANISGIYMFGKIKFDIDRIKQYQTPGWANTTGSGINNKFDLRSYGFNFEPSIGLNAGQGLPIFTLGLRYQLTKYKISEDIPQLSGIDRKWFVDQIYGVFVGVLYSI